MSYKLRSTLVGHEADVRCVAPAFFPEGGVLTCSRDSSTRVWSPTESNPADFEEVNIFYGHKGYVGVVCAVQPNEKYPQGLIITGGNDKLILIFDFNSVEPIQRLEGHTGAVCTLDAGKYGVIMSGSWDGTARVWTNGKTVMTLNDHTAAVWSVKMIPDKGLMLTGSADKTIKLWKAGKCERTYTGHKDCVRCLAILSMNEFLSCSNDGTVRRWLLEGDCIQIYEGHTSFVYSIAVIPGTNGSFVSSGEDRKVKIWKDDACSQTITLPAQSIWSVNALQNGDIIVGSSDALTRVFTCDASRYASEDKIKEFEETVANQAIPAASSLDLGDIKVDQLPGPEALLRPGTKKDQPKLIKRDGIVEAYQWDDVDGRWQKVGEVTGAAGEEGTKRTSGKEIYEGKEYDYVFNVDIEEGKPPLKLPFNITDDPWTTAQKFIDKHQLSQMFLDQVASFITKNTEGITLGAANPQHSDPFTGGNRYIPGAASNITSSASVAVSSNPDPFTGGTTNISNGGTGTAHMRYYPETKYLTFTTGNSEKIIGKAKEFNQQVDITIQLTAEEIEGISDVTSNILQNSSIKLTEEKSSGISSSLTKMVKWPQDKLIPVLDILRVFVLNETLSNDYVFSESHSDVFIQQLIQIAKNIQPLAHSMLVYRILTNSFSHPKAAVGVYKHKQEILNCCDELYAKQHKNLSIAVSSFIVNCCVYCRNSSVGFEDRVQLSSCIIQFLQLHQENESQFRLLVSLGTLITSNNDLVAFVNSLDVCTILKSLAAVTDSDKVKSCTSQLIQQL